MQWKVESIPCNLCAVDQSCTLFENDSHGFGLRTVICRNCGLVYLNPRPTPSEYTRLYSGIYETLFPSAWDLSLAQFKASCRLGWYRAYFPARGGFLEVGPGDGAFLKLLQSSSSFTTVVGIEPSPKAVAVCRRRGLNVEEGYLTANSSAARYDCIAAFHVLEHALDPVALLREFHSRLNDGGALFLEVPNILGNWRGLGMIHIAHPYQFSPDSLRYALSLAGFSVISMDPLEEPIFEASIRAIARKETGPLPSVGPEVPTALILRLFAERLSNWKLDMFKYRAKRTVFRLTGIAAARRHLSLRRLSTA